ncbi:MAG: universal stress protein, partial [Bacteroidota bacterium]
MKPIKKILVPVDYSPTASNAFTYALLLASELGAEIQLLNCVHPGMAAPEIPSLTVDLTHKLIGISQE